MLADNRFSFSIGPAGPYTNAADLEDTIAQAAAALRAQDDEEALAYIYRRRNTNKRRFAGYVRADGSFLDSGVVGDRIL